MNFSSTLLLNTCDEAISTLNYLEEYTSPPNTLEAYNAAFLDAHRRKLFESEKAYMESLSRSTGERRNVANFLRIDLGRAEN